MSITPIAKMMPTRLAIASLIALNVVAASDAAGPRVESTRHGRLAGGHIYAGQVSLPADGLWTVHAPDDSYSIRELYLTPSQPTRLRQMGERMYAAIEERQIRHGRWQVQMGFEACRQFAQEGDGVGPESIDRLAQDERWEHLSIRWDAAPWRTNEVADLIDEDPLQGQFIHLIPNVRFDFVEPHDEPTDDEPDVAAASTAKRSTRMSVPSDRRTELAFELRPFVGDGKHWVLYTDGKCERVAIDPALLAAHRVTIRPIMVDQGPDGANSRYQIVAVSDRPFNGSLSLSAHNHVIDRDMTIRWDTPLSSAEPLKRIRGDLDRARSYAWQPYLSSGAGGMLQIWDKSARRAETTPTSRRGLTMFSVLGGRAAIEETLQLQDLAVADVESSPSINIDSIKGVEVTSHPFESMLDGEAGGSLEMARVVPTDRFFLYVGKPESITALLDTGAPFVASLGTALTGNCLHYNLETAVPKPSWDVA